MLAGAILAVGVSGCRGEGGGGRLASVGTVPSTSFVWSGALTARSVDVVAGLVVGDSARLVVRPEPDSLRTFQSGRFAVAGERGVVRAALRGLTPDVRYTYAFEVEGRSMQEGAFRTPAVGPFSFTVAAGACARTGSNHPVFDAIRTVEPLFFMHLGDMFYEDILDPSEALYRRAYGRVLSAPAQARLYRSTPITYVWDDHDFGPNDADRSAPGQEVARHTYQRLIPHYPLSGDAIYQAFTVGRVRFVVTDLRSAREPLLEGRDEEGDVRSMMGAEQKAWFKRELLDANGRYPVIVWVSTVPWIGAARLGADHWGGFAAERREIADFVKANRIRGLTILSGDAHMVAMDDGSNSDYATGGGPSIPVVHAGPLDQRGSVKGGPYSEGAIPGPSTFPPHRGQWVEMRVEDTGGAEVCVRWTGFRTDWRSTATEELVRMGRCFPASPLGDEVDAPERVVKPSVTVEPVF